MDVVELSIVQQRRHDQPRIVRDLAMREGTTVVCSIRVTIVRDHRERLGV